MSLILQALRKLEQQSEFPSLPADISNRDSTGKSVAGQHADSDSDSDEQREAVRDSSSSAAFGMEQMDTKKDSRHELSEQLFVVTQQSVKPSAEEAHLQREESEEDVEDDYNIPATDELSPPDELASTNEATFGETNGYAATVARPEQESAAVPELPSDGFGQTFSDEYDHEPGAQHDDYTRESTDGEAAEDPPGLTGDVYIDDSDDADENLPFYNPVVEAVDLDAPVDEHQYGVAVKHPSMNYDSKHPVSLGSQPHKDVAPSQDELVLQDSTLQTDDVEWTDETPPYEGTTDPTGQSMGDRSEAYDFLGEAQEAESQYGATDYSVEVESNSHSVAPTEYERQILERLTNSQYESRFNEVFDGIVRLASDKQPLNIAVVGPTTSEVSSRLASHLAIVVASSHRKYVQLIDANGSRLLSTHFGHETDIGLFEACTTDGPETVQRQFTSLPTLHFVPFGNSVDGEFDSFCAARTSELCQGLRIIYDEYEVNILDAGSVMDASARAIVAAADVIVLCAEIGAATPEQLAEAEQLLKAAGAPLIGCVISGEFATKV